MERRERIIFVKTQPQSSEATDMHDKRITDDGLISFNELTLLVACFFALVFLCTLCSCTSVSGIIVWFNYLGNMPTILLFPLIYRRYLYKSTKHMCVDVYIVVIMKHFTY